MALTLDSIIQPLTSTFCISLSLLSALVGLIVLKCLYNISPLHPLSKYPGPLLWRASRLPASYHHAVGDLYQHIASIHATYGGTVRIAPDELSFTSPAAWIQIYNSRPQMPKSPHHFAPTGADAKLPESMITAPDAEHMRLRRLAGPAFLNSGVAEVEPVLQQYSELLCAALKEDVVKKAGESVNMVEWFLWTLNDVIGQLALDQEFKCLELRRLHPWPSFLMGVLKSTAAINQFIRFGLRLTWVSAFLSQKMVEERENFFNVAMEATSTRLRKEKDEAEDVGAEKAGKKRSDIVGVMLREMKGREKLTEKEITSNSVLIVGGGAETTSTCLSATVYHLCKTPRVLAKLKDEIRTTFATSEDITVKATANLPYLKATIDESLRIFPVASYICPRVTPKEGHVIDGEMIPAGTHVSMGQWYMGRSERFFDNPKDFRPERWTEAESGMTGPAGLTAEEILRPFSLGPRNCIGKLLALAEAKLVIAKLLWHFDIELDGDHSTWIDDARFYVLWQLKPLKVRLTPVKR